MERLELIKRDDIEKCFAIIDNARNFQLAQGFTQWDKTYPSIDTIKEDLEKNIGYKYVVGGVIASYMAIVDYEPTYDKIDGKWLSEEKYFVIHRIGIDEKYRGQGIAYKIFNACEELAKSKNIFSLRIDTSHENKRMQHVVKKAGFIECGLCYYEKGERIVYEKLLK